MGQGYLFVPPLDAEDVSRLLADPSSSPSLARLASEPST